VGLREAAKFLKVHKVSCLLLAPDLEKVAAAGGLDDAVTGLAREAAAQEPPVPVVFALNRRRLGRACLRKVPVSCVAVMNPQGADETYKSLLALAASLAEQYRARLAGEVAALEAAAMAPSATPATSPTPSTTSSLPELAVHAPVFVPRHLEQWVLAEQWELAEQSYPELPLGYQGFGQAYYSHW